MRGAIVTAAIAALVAGLGWYRLSSTTLSIDTAQLAAPAIALSSDTGGTLQELLVKPGDRVAADEIVARVGTSLVKAKVSGEVIAVKDDVGAQVNRGEAVVTMIDRTALRVVVRIKEDKGLSRIVPGQLARFTVDAFPGRTYAGVVDEVAPTSRESGVLFTISDKRETKEFEVKIKFDAEQGAELKNGMSAKVTVYTK
jgi:multidrug resistance efflux pump